MPWVLYPHQAMNEAQKIALLRTVLGGGLSGAEGRGIAVSIGDDAAVLDGEKARGCALVVSVDEQVEGTHFRRELLPPEDIGYRATMAAASDLAAMGATPWCAVASMVVPSWVDDDVLARLAKGQREASDRLAMPIVGGNLARGAALSIATTVLGLVREKPLLRSGARAHDGIYVAGEVGLAALGLKAILACNHDEDTAMARQRWRRPTARIGEGERASSIAHAAVDLSDGLAKDVGAIARDSALDAVLEEGALARLAEDSGARAAADVLGAEWMEAMLAGGEDYALVVTSDRPIEGFQRIGTMVPIEEPRSEGQVWLMGKDGRRSSFPLVGGFDHFGEER